MITAFVFENDQLVTTVDSIAALPDWLIRPNAWLWLDLEAPDEDTVRQVGALFALAPEPLEDCRQGDQRPRFEEFDDYNFMVIYGAPSPEESGFDPHKLGVFFGERFLITAHRDAMRSLGAVRERIRRAGKGAVPKSVDGVLYVLLDALVDRYVDVVDAYDDELDRLEEAALGPRPPRTLLMEAADLRRKIREFHRIAGTQQELLTPLAQGEYDYIAQPLFARFGHVSGHLANVIFRLEQLRERLNAVLDHYNTSLTQHTNEVIKTLTIFATTLMPLSLVAGIYGMNLPLWPNPGHPASFWSVIGVMLAVAGGMIYSFRRRGWF